jgi:hypothetical protein
MEKVIIPKYVDTIIVYNTTKKNEKLIKRAGLSFDENGECELTMEFYDGIAYEVNGTGLIMRYPKMKDLTTSKENIICEYTGIYDGEINQHDVALTYGVLELSNNKSDKLVHWTLDSLHLRDETLIMMSADLYQKIYNMSDDNMDYNRAARIVRILADQFEKELDWQGGENEDRDYILELEKFEEKALKELERKINIDKKFD